MLLHSFLTLNLVPFQFTDLFEFGFRLHLQFVQNPVTLNRFKFVLLHFLLSQHFLGQLFMFELSLPFNCIHFQADLVVYGFD
jgi:hypothetical protein